MIPEIERKKICTYVDNCYITIVKCSYFMLTSFLRKTCLYLISYIVSCTSGNWDIPCAAIPTLPPHTYNIIHVAEMCS